MIVNVYAAPWGWLFSDLRAELARVDLSDKCVCTPGNRCRWHVEVVESDEPLPDADAWICIRTDEAGKCPDLSRCVVQVHDYREHDIPMPAVVQYINDEQHDIDWHRAETSPQMASCWTGAIGPRSGFRVRESMPERATIGWCGRDVVYRSRHIKRPELFVEVVRELRAAGVEVDVEIYGDKSMERYAKDCGLHEVWANFKLVGTQDAMSMTAGCSLRAGSRSVASLQSFYHSIDVLVSTTEPEPGPLSIYEALACGVPVVSTPTGAAEEVGYNSGCFVTSDDLEPWEATAAIVDERAGWFSRRHEFGQSVAHLSQEAWARRSVELAVEVANG